MRNLKNAPLLALVAVSGQVAAFVPPTVVPEASSVVTALRASRGADAIESRSTRTSTRRDVFVKASAAVTAGLAWALQSDVALAGKIKPDEAFASLVKARKELQTVGETYLPKRDWEGLRTYLEQDAVNLNAYEANAGALLESKRLDAESKKDIGTIRRYGVGADVIIMYGGLKNEVDEENENPNGSEIAKYLRRTADSLDEVIAICRSNGF